MAPRSASAQLASDGAGGVVAGYVYGPGADGPLMRFDASGDPVYYLEDALDSVGSYNRKLWMKTWQ